MCNFNAIFNGNDSAVQELNVKMAEYAKAVVADVPASTLTSSSTSSRFVTATVKMMCRFYRTLECLPALTRSLSTSALRRCLQRSKAHPGSLLDEHMHADDFCDLHDHFRNTTPESEWGSCLAHAEKIGLGHRAYELIKV